MNEAVKQALLNNMPFDIKFYIRDDNDVLVDFSDRCQINGRNSLLDISDIELSGESSVFYGQANSHDVKITVDNSDRFWNKAPSHIAELKTVNDTAAVFTDYFGKTCKIKRKQYLLNGGSIEFDLNTYMLQRVSPGSSLSNTAVLTLTGIQKKLKDVPAKIVKNGNQWYRYRTIKYIIRKILERVHTSAEIVGFDLPDNIEIQNQVQSNPNDTSDYRALSQTFRLPGPDENGKWTDAEYSSLIGRRLLYNINLSSDVFYIGINHNIYSYNFSENCCNKLSNDELGATYNINRLWYNSNDGFIWGVAWNVPAANELLSTIKIFIFNITTNVLTIKSTINNVFTGEFCYINNANFWGAYQEENLTLPFEQYVRSLDSGLPTLITRAGLWNTSGGDTYTGLAPRGYYTILAYQYFVHTKFNMGQVGFCEFNEDNNLILFSVMELDSEKDPVHVYIKKYNCSTDVLSTLYDFSDIHNNEHPTCAATDGDYLYLATIFWKRSAESPSISYIRRINVNSGTMQTLFDSTDIAIDEYAFFLEMIHSGNQLYFSYMRRDELNSTPYYLGTHYDYTVDNSITSGTSANPNQYRGLLKTTNDNLICVECNTGKLKQYLPGGTPDIMTMDNIQSINEIDFNVASNLIERYNTANDEYEYWGISAPDYPNFCFATDKAGSYSLFKFSKYLFTDRSLYDLNDLNCWEAINLLADCCDYICNYDRFGNFFFRKRPTSGTAIETFRNDLGENMIEEIYVNDMHDELWNCAVITPWGVTVDKIETEIILSPNSDWDGQTNDVLVGVQTLNSFYIIMICTQTNKFKWKNFYAQIETQLSAAVNSGDRILTLGLEPSIISGSDNQIADGDLVKFQDSDGNDVKREITDYDYGEGQIQIEAAGVPQNLPAGTELTIIKSDNNEWSSDTAIDFSSTPMTAKALTGTGISVRLLTTNGYYPFVAGDQIVIKSNGLILKELTHSPQSAYDVTSIAKYGKRAFPNSKNKFYDTRMAKNKSNYIVKNHKAPRFNGTLTGLAVFDAEICDIIDQIDRLSYPSEIGNYQKSYLTQIRYPIRSNRAIYSFNGISNRRL